jgi:zinc protease
LEDSVVRQYKTVPSTLLLVLLAASPQFANRRIESDRHAHGEHAWGAGAQNIPAVKRDLLLNELQLMVLPHPGTGTIMVHLRVNSGAMFDLAGKGGLADITAGMLLRSAKGFPAKDLSEYMTQQGMTLNVRVGWDSTDITISGPAALLESIIDLLGLLVINPSFGQPEFDSLKASRIKELSAEAPGPLEVAKETAVEALYGRYPLGRPVHGTADSISKINRDDIAYYHNRFYIANDAELAVEGDVTPEEVTKFARSKLGIWKKGEKVPATFVPPEPLSSRKIVVMDRPDSTDAALVLAGHGISRRASDYLATAVMARLLESVIARSTSRAATGVRTRLEARYLPGPLSVALDCRAEKASAALQACLDAIERLKSAESPQEEVERAKQSVIASYAQDTATAEGQINALLDIEQYGLGRDYMMNFEARVAAVSADEVKSAAQKHLNSAALAISVVGPAAALSDGLKKIGQVSVVAGRHTF